MGTDPAAVAAAVVEDLRAGRFADVEARFAPRLRSAVSGDTLALAWSGELSRLGAVRDAGEPSTEPGGKGLVRVRVPVDCERGGLTVVMSVDDAGLLHGFRLAPPAGQEWTPPSYAARGRFTEQELTVGSGPLAVPGTLTLPRGRGARRPGVVLLASGPSDRDLTTGPNKPFKDLAWGLAERGIAVLRFDKLTFVHGEVAAEPGFTLADEYLAHARAAVRLLQEQPAVDPSRVFLAGHSGGGKAAPRVAAAEPSVAGVVIMAGDAHPLPDAAVRVARHLAGLGGAEAPPDVVAAVTRQAALAASADLTPDTPAQDLLFGWPASYWLDLRDYDPVGTAAALDRPLLVLQGRRDYQVTVEHDLVRWREGLAHRPDVTVRVLDADDHMFFPGSGPSTPAGYQTPQHLDPAVVIAIADWMTDRQTHGGEGRLTTWLRSRTRR